VSTTTVIKANEKGADSIVAPRLEVIADGRASHTCARPHEPVRRVRVGELLRRRPCIRVSVQPRLLFCPCLKITAGGQRR